MKSKKNKRKIIGILVAFVLVFATVLTVTLVNRKPIALPANGDESPANYIEASANPYGGTQYSFVLTDRIDPPEFQVGYQLETLDYVYTYGYRWDSSSNAVASKGSLTNWVATGDDSFGVAVKNRNKTTYENLYTKISTSYVLYMTYTFANCTRMETAPTLPSYAKDVTGIFYNCTALKNVRLPNGWTSLDNLAFYHCTSLEYIYIPKSITTITCTETTTPFYKCSNKLTVYTETETQTQTYSTSWCWYEPNTPVTVIKEVPYAEYHAMMHSDESVTCEYCL